MAQATTHATGADPEALLPQAGGNQGGAARAAGEGEGFKCGITDRAVFGINRNSLMLIVQLLSVALSVAMAIVSQVLPGSAAATTVLASILAALNTMAGMLKTDPGEHAVTAPGTGEQFVAAPSGGVRAGRREPQEPKAAGLI